MQMKKNIFKGILPTFQFSNLPVHKKKREYFFNEFYVAGYRYYDGVSIEDSLMEGKIVQFKREPGCAHDPKAVEIYSGGKKLGYIPKKDNASIASLMDQGITIRGKIQKRNFDDQLRKRIKISAFKEYSD